MPVKSWAEVEAQSPGGWPGLLVGNGASLNVSTAFGYPTLYQKACNLGPPRGFDAVDQQLFERFETRDFEIVLGNLRTTLQVGEILHTAKQDRQRVRERYDRVKGALVGAVQSLHPKRAAVGHDRLAAIGQALLAYDWVFSTNYDLLIYWAANEVGIRNFYDFLRGDPCRFREANKVPAKGTKLLFLHGGLHLFVPIQGPYREIVHKRVGKTENILSQLGPYRDAPLVITEGSANDKLLAIREHPYLIFAYEALATFKEPLVIFGSKLGDSDGHLLDVLARQPKRKMAISIRETGAAANSVMSRLENTFPDATLSFFKADTHPLGDAALRVA